MTTVSPPRPPVELDRAADEFTTLTQFLDFYRSVLHMIEEYARH